MPSISSSSSSDPKPLSMTDIQPNGSYRVFGAYRDPSLMNAISPYLIAPKARINTESKVTIQNLYQSPPTAAPAQPTPPPPASAPRTIDNSDFKLEWVDATPANLANNSDKIKVLITIKNLNAWKADTSARQVLRANFVDFCAQVEILELNDQVLAEGGAEVIAQRVAEALPMPIDESLFYRAGFNPGFGAANSPYVDLRPGMRLRVDFAANQFVAPGSQLNGLVGTGQFYFYIGRDDNQRVVFDTFLSAIAAPELAAPLGQATASGAIDLQASGAARRHYRLFFPTQLPPATAAGDTRLARNVTLIGADTLGDLQMATTAYIQRAEIGTAASGNLPIIAIGFRGRTVAVPEIGVYINRQVGGDLRHSALTYVPVGTTLRQLLDQQAGAWNPGQLYGESGTIKLWRFWAEDNGVPQYRKVILNPVRTTDVRVFDLPLARSDILDIRFSMDS
jgi:hypothetical protein